MSYHINKVLFYSTLTLSVPGRGCFFNPPPPPLRKMGYLSSNLTTFWKETVLAELQPSGKLPQNNWY